MPFDWPKPRPDHSDHHAPRRHDADTRRATVRRRGIAAATLLALAGCAGCGTTLTPIHQGAIQTWLSGPPRFDHVLIVVLENESANEIPAHGYLDSLARRGAALRDFHGEAHPSYPNYLALVAGETFGVRGDRQSNIDAPTIADRLEAKGLTWKVYAEGYPGNCFLGSSSGKYARKHVPFLSFIPIQRDSARCANVVNSSQFDAANLPSYALYIPDLNHDGHNTTLAYATQWLRGFLEPLLANQAVMQRTLVIITFDESEGHEATNRIYTVMLGGTVRPGAVDSTPLNHYNLLRTIEANFGLEPLARERDVTPITTIWNDSLGVPGTSSAPR